MKPEFVGETESRVIRCPSHFHFIHNLSMTPDADEKREAKQWGCDMQAQCLELIHSIAIRENIEDFPAIEFIAGIGISCSELESSIELKE